MKQIEILDCTLRDGGRVIDCRYPDETIIGLGKHLKRAGINVIEMGFLRDDAVFAGNSTFFSSPADCDVYIEQICENESRQNEKYVVFVDFGLYDVNCLEEAEKVRVSGIRFGFTKKDYMEHKRQVVEAVIRQLGALDSDELGVPLGSLTGQPLLSGVGPRVRVRVDSVGEVTADYDNTFTSAGVNQTLHRVCLNINAAVYLFLPGEVYPVSVSSSVCVAETVIVGETPDTYLNLEKGNG